MDFEIISKISRGEFTHPVSKKVCKKFLIATHLAPDGDAVGSAVAYAHLVLHFGGTPVLYLPEGASDSFLWVNTPCPIIYDFSALLTLGVDGSPFKPDVLAFFDCADAARAGQPVVTALKNQEICAELSAQHAPFPVTICIDHHEGNPCFADYNFVQPQTAATAQMVGYLAESLGVTLENGLGEAIFLGLVTDTGYLSFPNTTGETFAMAGRLVDAGLSLDEFTRKRLYNWSFERMQMWGYLMQNITLHHNGAVAVCIVYQKDFKKFQTSKSDLEDFADMMKRFSGVSVVVFIREEENTTCRVSLRSIGGVDIRQVAVTFGGGGHKAASGLTTTLSPEETRHAVLEKIADILSKNDALPA